MRIISRRALREFASQHAGARQPLDHWANAVEAADWHSPAEVRATFRSVDFVGELTVFDIAGNKFRLIAYVHYRKQLVFIKDILTHKDYDKGDWKQ